MELKPCHAARGTAHQGGVAVPPLPRSIALQLILGWFSKSLVHFNYIRQHNGDLSS